MSGTSRVYNVLQLEGHSHSSIGMWLVRRFAAVML